VIGRLRHGTDFERVLRTPPRARSEHFAIHHLHALPQALLPAARRELSTDVAPDRLNPVDDLLAPVLGMWAGTVVPKRHARRSVTRVLIKRQIRRSLLAHQAELGAGLWVVRLRAPFDPRTYPSAASAALRLAAAAELDAAFGQAAARSRAG
jgi:ribonuclease P protein component